MVRERNPEKYAKAMAIKLSEEEHKAIKTLASKQGKSIKAVILDALEKVFPGWREENK